MHVTPIVMVFLSELVSEIRDLDSNLKRQLVEAYNAIGADNDDDNGVMNDFSLVLKGMGMIIMLIIIANYINDPY